MFVLAKTSWKNANIGLFDIRVIGGEVTPNYTTSVQAQNPQLLFLKNRSVIMVIF